MLSRFATLGRIPRGVWILGGVSLLMDVSSEMIHSLLPLFSDDARRQRDRHRADRRAGGGDGIGRQGILRRAQRLPRQA